MNPFFKKTLLFSFLGHLTFFSLFSFSFGNSLTSANFTGMDFRGSFLSDTDLNPLSGKSKSSNLSVCRAYDIYLMDKILSDKPLANNVSARINKPPVRFSISENKIDFHPIAVLPFDIKNKPSIMLYPRMPSYFNLYFKDRQLVHIELLFNISAKTPVKSVIVKRKISSGNLEADLLVMRYMSHYLYLQQTRFSPDVWQEVKIDLATNDDQHRF